MTTLTVDFQNQYVAQCAAVGAKALPIVSLPRTSEDAPSKLSYLKPCILLISPEYEDSMCDFGTAGEASPTVNNDVVNLPHTAGSGTSGAPTNNTESSASEGVNANTSSPIAPGTPNIGPASHPLNSNPATAPEAQENTLSLHIRHWKLPPKTIPTVSSALGGQLVSKIVGMHLVGCDLNADDLAELSISLSGLSECPLRHLTIKNNPVETASSSALANWSPPSSQPPPTVTVNTQSAPAAAPASPAVSTNVWRALLAALPDLHSLSLRGNSLSDADMAALATALRCHRSLLALNLMRNNIGRVGCELLADALKANCVLVALSIGCNQLTDEAAFALGRALGMQELSAEEVLLRRKYYAELERLRLAEEESEQANAGKKKGGKQTTGRGGSADERAGPGPKRAGAANSTGGGAAGKSAMGGASGAGAKDGAAGAASSSKAANAGPVSNVKKQTNDSSSADIKDTSGSKSTSPRKAVTPSTDPKGGAAKNKTAGGGLAVGKKGGVAADEPADEIVDDVAEVVTVPPLFDLQMFQVAPSTQPPMPSGTSQYYMWGNRSLAYLNLAQNKLSDQTVLYFLEVLDDQSPENKAMMTTNMYGDETLRNRPKQGLLRISLEGNLFGMEMVEVQELHRRLIDRQNAQVVEENTMQSMSVPRSTSGTAKK